MPTYGMMPYSRAGKVEETDKGSGPTALAEKGEQMKEDAREHIEDMVGAAQRLVQESSLQSSMQLKALASHSDVIHHAGVQSRLHPQDRAPSVDLHGHDVIPGFAGCSGGGYGGGA